MTVIGNVAGAMTAEREIKTGTENGNSNNGNSNNGRGSGTGHAPERRNPAKLSSSKVSLRHRLP